MTAVFLSASFPSGDRGEEVSPYYPADIGSAAATVVEAVLRSQATLVFGGHPTISPIVLQIAALLQAGDRVVIYQSEQFSAQITDEVRRLAEVGRATIRFTPWEETLAESLETMRRSIFAEDLRAAFFVGGMSGIADEYALLQEVQPSTPRFFFEAPGGMAARIARDLPRLDHVDTESLAEIWPSPYVPSIALNGRAYASLARRALSMVHLGRMDDSQGEL